MRAVFTLTLATLMLGCGVGTIGSVDEISTLIQDEGPLLCESGVTGVGNVRRSKDLAVETRDLPCLVGDGTLAGAFLAGIESSSVAGVPVAADHRFLYDPSDPRFDAVQAYYTLTHMANWVARSFDIEDPRLDDLASDHVHLDYDSSELESRQVCYRVLLGMRGLARDGVNLDVLTHEFGHHIVFAMNADLGNQMLHEGFADYFAAAFTRDAVIEPSEWSGFDRDLRNDRRAPGDLVTKREYCQSYVAALDHDQMSDYTEANEIMSGCLAGDNLDRLEPHWAGTILGAALWQLRAEMGEDALNRVLARGLRDAVVDDTGELLSAMLQADRDLFDGLNESLLIDAFAERGIDDDLGEDFPRLDYAACHQLSDH